MRQGRLVTYGVGNRHRAVPWDAASTSEVMHIGNPDGAWPLYAQDVAVRRREMTAGGAPAVGPGLSGALEASGPELRWRRVFPGEERQLGALRRWLELLLPECPERGDVACVATELGTNALRHTASGRGGWFAVEITRHRQAVRVAVADGGAPGAPQVLDDPQGEHGRGLLVVRGLSVRTGVCGDHRGRLVWADVPWGDAGVADSAAPQDHREAAMVSGLGWPIAASSTSGLKIAMSPRLDADVESGGNASAAQPGPPPCSDISAVVPPLPRRNRGTLLSAMPASTIWPPVEPELLRRVLAGLRQL
jgi:anti-sigma regulatory factor (Ser/Thr protein kinase)